MYIDILKNKEKELRDQIAASNDAAEVRSLGETLKAVTEEIRAIEEATKEADNAPSGAHMVNGEFMGRSGKADDDMEYRTAFMDYVLRGTPIPNELRDAASTTTTDAAAAIPSVVVNKIVEKMETAGNILALVSKTAFAAGVVIPTSSVKPVASWVGEGAGSDYQKKTLVGVTFTHHKLRCEISMSMEVGTMAVAAFEAAFVDNVVKAMIIAIESAIINGAGSNSPKGILAETPVTGQALSLPLTYANLCAAEGVLPEAYEAGAKWCMSKKTFAKVEGMVDANGQPIARVNYGIGGKAERYILGREVVICQHVAADTMFMFDFADYALNTVYDMGISKKQDWDTEDLRTKAVMAVDGKVVDKTSLVTFAITASA